MHNAHCSLTHAFFSFIYINVYKCTKYTNANVLCVCLLALSFPMPHFTFREMCVCVCLTVQVNAVKRIAPSSRIAFCFSKEIFLCTGFYDLSLKAGKILIEYIRFLVWFFSLSLTLSLFNSLDNRYNSCAFCFTLKHLPWLVFFSLDQLKCIYQF